MRYEDVRRLRGVESFWFRLRLWFTAAPRRSRPLVRNLSHLSDHLRRDVGIPDQVRFMDWHSLHEKNWP